MTLLDTELAEQPAAVARLLDDLPAHVRAVRRLATGCTGVTIVARGSSDNAARYGQYLVPLRAGLPVTLATPSLSTVYRHTPQMAGQLVLAVSQSGRSTDLVTVLEAASEQGRPIVAVTNDADSPVAALADHVITLRAGAEQSVAATKTYTTSLVAVAALAVALGPAGAETDALSDVARLPDLLAATLDLAEAPAAATGRLLLPASRAVSVGRGLNLCTAHEVALKIAELSGTQVVPYSSADLLHGPVGAVDREVPVLLVAPDEAATASVLELIPGLAARGAPVHLLAAAANLEHLGPGAAAPVTAETIAGAASVVPLPPGVPDWLSPVVAVVPGQLVARSLAVARGVDVDHPGGLSKITITR